MPARSRCPPSPPCHYSGRMTSEKNRKKHRLLRCGLAISLVGIAVVAASNIYMTVSTNDRVFTESRALPSSVNAEAIVVLGARVYEDGTPSVVLTDRLVVGLELWQEGRAPVIVVSGSNAPEQPQVDVMAEWLEDRGVPPDAIIHDEGGVNTYDSMWRARHEYGLSRVIVVSQKFHLARAIYNGERQGLEVWAVASDIQPYRKLWQWQVREWGARTKGLVMGVIKPDAGVIDF